MDEAAAGGRPLPPPLPFSPVTAGHGRRRRRQREQLQEAMAASAVDKERELERLIEEMERDMEVATREVAELEAKIIVAKREKCGSITSCALVFGCLFIVIIIAIPFHYVANSEYKFNVKVLLVKLDFVIKLMQNDTIIRRSANSTDTVNNVNRVTRIRDYILKTNALFGA